ncbi:MAG: metal ABC transporter permease [Methanomassiliicoccaceae archaeon]|nr:metal ABC transporter permease [Methanomassiliicoccaceae archaeon]
MTDWIAVLPIYQDMFLAAVIACILCGVVGTFVVVNRMVAVTGGIAHTMFGGVGFAYFAMSVLMVSWLTPMWGALIFGLAAALILSLTSKMKRIRQDSMIGVLWALGMAAGVIFMSMMDRSVITPHSYEAILFGDILFVGSSTLIMMAIVSAAILVIVALLYREFQILTFDSANAHLLGVNVPLMRTILYVIITVACVMVTNVVGIIMIIALMTIPVAMANLFLKNLKDTMIYASVLSTVFAVFGLFLSIAFDVPPGATVVLVIGCAFVVAILLKYVMDRSAVQSSGT